MEENRKYWMIVCFLFLLYNLHGQKQKYLFIRILDDQNFPIQDANIFLQDTFSSITNVDGFAKVSLQKENTIKITIKHLSFETKDTILKEQTQRLNITIKLKPLWYEIDEITVSPTEHISDLKNTNFSDIYLIENQIVALQSKGDHVYLKFYDSLGNYTQLNYKFEQKGKYQSIEKGYVSGQYYLLGNKDCIPFTIQGDSNFILKEQSIISRKKYNEIFDGIVFFKDSMLIKKVVSQHGNMLDIYAYNTKNYNRKLLYNIFNEKNAKDANRNYNIIKSIYLRNLKAPDDRDIDYGIERLDITKDPNWKGDIKDLIVHNDQLSYVSNFQVATQGINFDTKIDGRNFLILDNVHNILSNYDLANLKLKTQIIFPESKTNFNFVLSNFNICINNEINYFCWDEIYRIWHRLNINVKNIYYPKRKILIGNHVFVLGRRSIDVVHNQVFMLKYNDL